MPIDILLQRLIELIWDDAKALVCVDEVSRSYDILKHGASADEQLRVYTDTRAAGRGRLQAVKDVVDWLQRETAK